MERKVIEQAIESIDGASIASIDAITEVKLTGGKKNPFQGRVQKKTTGAQVMIFTNKNSNGYQNMVRRRLVQEGKNPETFELKPRAWGTRVEESPLIEHTNAKGDYSEYIEVVYLKAGKSTYLVDGVETPKEDIEGIPVSKVYETQQGGLEDQVVIRSYKLESIDAIRINGQEFRD